jgi:DNA-binding NarL/FixJ family response regulator
MALETTYEQQIAVTNRPRLVVADDEALVRSMLCAQLEHEFECVGAAADAEEAIALVEAHRPDVAIRNTDPTTG